MKNNLTETTNQQYYEWTEGPLTYQAHVECEVNTIDDSFDHDFGTEACSHDIYTVIGGEVTVYTEDALVATIKWDELLKGTKEMIEEGINE